MYRIILEKGCHCVKTDDWNVENKDTASCHTCKYMMWSITFNKIPSVVAKSAFATEKTFRFSFCFTTAVTCRTSALLQNCFVAYLKNRLFRACSELNSFLTVSPLYELRWVDIITAKLNAVKFVLWRIGAHLYQQRETQWSSGHTVLATFVHCNQWNPDPYAEDSKLTGHIPTNLHYTTNVRIYAKCSFTDSFFQQPLHLGHLDESEVLHDSIPSAITAPA